MPVINLVTSLEKVEKEEELLMELSRTLARLTGKPESYVMTSIQTKVSMTFSGTSEPSCYVEIKSIGAIDPPSMSSIFCKLIANKTNISESRIYLKFDDVSPDLWGWNGKTFG